MRKFDFSLTEIDMIRLLSNILLLSSMFLLFICGINCNDKNEQAIDGKKNASNLQTVQNNRSKVENSDTQANSLISSISNFKYPEENILGVWTIDPDGPHADFEINKDYYFIVDQEENGNVLYLIKGDSIIVYFRDFASRGQITKAQKDTLIINWDNQGSTMYTRWKE